MSRVFWGIAETTGVVKNRMDLFDPYFDIIEKVGGKNLRGVCV